jgi:hypothetical protein
VNWDAIGAIAELLGAIGVIASLVYLATQIRQSRQQMSQNTRALQGGAFQQLQHSVRESWSQVLAVPGLDRVVRLGMTDLGQLNEEDSWRFTFFLGAVIKVYDNDFFQYRLGMLVEERWQYFSKELLSVFRSPGARQWWKTTSDLDRSLSPEFVALVEEILGEEPEQTDPTR